MNITGKTAGEIFDQIRAMVQTGELAAGTALPPMRDLAAQLNVNRNTVAAAYKRLVDSGFALSKGRNGTLIRDMLAPAIQEGATPGIALRDLAGGNPSPALLPELRLPPSSGSRPPGLYGEALINSELEQIGRRWMDEDIHAKYELNLTSGAVDAIERLLTSYLIAGDRVAMEDPCFLSSINTLKNHRLVPMGVAMDEQGIQCEPLEAALASGVQAVVITPRAHNPTGWGLSAERAAKVRDILAKYPEVLVIVDDHFSRLSTHEYYSVIPPGTRHWALIRSTSKFLGPDLRLAFVASDMETSLRLQQRLNGGINWVSHLIQDIATASLISPELAENLETAKQTYRARRERLLHALEQRGIAVSPVHDGLNIWLPLSTDSSAAVMALARYGWLVRGGEIFGLEQACHGLRITVSDLDDATIDELATVLAGILR